MIDMTHNPPFFIVGIDRSGTTLLRLMLNANSQLTIPPESHFIPKLLESLSPLSDLTPEQIDHAVKVITDEPRFRGWYQTRETIDVLVRESDPKRLIDLLARLYKSENDVLSVPNLRWGDKTAEYIRYMQLLSTAFPDSQFVHIVRDGRDVNASLQKNGWRGWTVWERAKYWSKYVTMAEDLGAKIGPNRYFRMNYENLVLDTETTLSNVCRFLGVDFEPAMLDYTNRPESVLAHFEVKAHLHDKVTRLPKPSDANRWKENPRSTQNILFESLAWRTMSRVGQQVTPPVVVKRICIRIGYVPYAVVFSQTVKLYHRLPMKFRVWIRRSLRGRNV